MAIITFTSDFGLKDHYVSAVKGAIFNIKPDALIVDISHEIEKYNIQYAAYVLQNAYANFPAKTIHIIALETEINETKNYVIVDYNNHYFISADDGIFSLMFEELPAAVYEIAVKSTISPTFIAKDIFAPVAASLANGSNPSDIGTRKEKLLQRMPFKASSMGDIIRGSIAYIDSYHNAITNIDKILFDRIGQGREFSIEFRGYQINTVSTNYNQVPEGEMLALFNSSGFLEIAIRRSSASGLLHLKPTDPVIINFA